MPVKRYYVMNALVPLTRTGVWIFMTNPDNQILIIYHVDKQSGQQPLKAKFSDVSNSPA